MNPSRFSFFHFVTCIGVSSLYPHGLRAHFLSTLSNVRLSGRTTICLLTHSPTEGRIGCFQVLEITSEAAIDIMCRVLCGCKVLTPLSGY